MASLSLKMRIIGIVTLACLLGAVISISGFLYFNRRAVENGIVNKAKTIHTQLAAATNYVAKQGGLAQVISTYRSKYHSAQELTEADKKEILKQVPIYAAIAIGNENQERDQYHFRVISDEPRRKENLATEKERVIFKKFEDNPKLDEFIDSEGQIITVYRPVRLQESQGCLECHGNPTRSPWGNGTDILGFKMENWSDGKLHGVFAVSQDLDAVVKASTGDSFISPSGWLISAIILGAVLSILISILLMRGSISVLTRTAQNLFAVSGTLNEASDEVAKSSNDLARSTSDQAASLQQTSAALEQISAMISKASGNASLASESSVESNDEAVSGQRAVEQMMASMDQIKNGNKSILVQFQENDKQMAEIVNLIRAIGTKTKVINEIVFQTKLLSFNASVEAARAGENGKGFSVVAEEVGSLAQMSGQAAKEISEMLDSSVAAVENIVQQSKLKVQALIDDSESRVENGVRVASQCSEALNKIVSNVENVSKLSHEISQASSEQSQGVTEINKAMTQLDSVTQRNATSGAQAANAAVSLSTQSQALKDSLDELMGVIDGSQKRIAKSASPLSSRRAGRTSDVDDESQQAS